MKKLIILLSILTLNSNNEKIYCDIKGNIKKPGVYEIKDNYTIQDVIEDAGGLKNNSYTDNINLSKKVTDEMVIYIFSKKEIKEAKEIEECICEPIYKYIECPSTEENIKTTIPTTIKTTTTSIKEEIITTKPIVTTKERTSTTTTTNPTTTIKTEVPITTQKETTTNITTTTKGKIEDSIININNASLKELMTLNGLGEKKAYAIIEYRNNNGLFETIEDIMNVNGIGKTTFEKIKDFIKV